MRSDMAGDVLQAQRHVQCRKAASLSSAGDMERLRGSDRDRVGDRQLPDDVSFSVGKQLTVDFPRQRKYSGSLHGVHQHRRAEPDAADGHRFRSALAQSLRISDSGGQLSNLCASRGQANIGESDQRGHSLQSDLHRQHNWVHADRIIQRIAGNRYDSLRDVRNLHGRCQTGVWSLQHPHHAQLQRASR